VRTEYQLWTGQPGDRWSNVGQFDSATAAMAAAGIPNPTSWKSIDDRYIADGGDGSEHGIHPTQVPESDADRISLALDLALGGGGTDGAHHKTWYLDQIVRTLAGDQYETVIAEYRDGEDGPETYEWDEGIAP